MCFRWEKEVGNCKCIGFFIWICVLGKSGLVNYSCIMFGFILVGFYFKGLLVVLNDRLFINFKLFFGVK